jgi:pimeloyl-ACP methyl ester carboxylesterase
LPSEGNARGWITYGQKARPEHARSNESKIASAGRRPWPHLLVLRGVHSDLLSFDLAAVMRKRNRMVNLFQFDDSGHVPPLMAPEQIDLVNRFLLDDASSGAEKR